MPRSSRTLAWLKKAKMKIFFLGPKMEMRRRCALWCVLACVLSTVFARSLQARSWNRKPFNWGFGRALGSQDFFVSSNDILESKISLRDEMFNLSIIHYRLFAWGKVNFLGLWNAGNSSLSISLRFRSLSLTEIQFLVFIINCNPFQSDKLT